jgi:hypothetical protein
MKTSDQEDIMDVIKTVGNSGQISIGKKYAGQTVLLSELDQGVWIIKVGRFIPDNEKWIHASEIRAELDEAIAWAEKNPAKETNFDQLEARIK